ncbi:MAG: hypothetical protein Q7J74_04745, partial [Pseudomonas sp.]|nr:hypothetical protein [Pseudomonas sp.]
MIRMYLIAVLALVFSLRVYGFDFEAGSVTSDARSDSFLDSVLSLKDEGLILAKISSLRYIDI